MTPRTAAELRALRDRADPLADDAVAALAASGAPPRPGDDVLARVRAGARTEPALARFVDGTRALPPFAEVRAYRAGRRALLRHAPVTFLVLLSGSLVESFAVAEGAAVLVGTGRLLREPLRRIYETASLVRDLLVDDAFAPFGPAHAALLRVRLLHAFVRRYTRAAHDGGRGPWSPASGAPVNQADMLHTQLMFSRVLVDGAGRLGACLDEHERASWFALWRASGALLGIEDELMPRNLDDERALHDLVRTTYRPDDGSRALTFAVLDAMAAQPPFYLPAPALYAISRAVVGDDLADALELPRSARWAGFVRGLATSWRALDVLERHLPLGVRAGVAGGRAFIEVNRWRVLRTMPPASYGFRTA